MRWRSFKDEPPEIGETILLKVNGFHEVIQAHNLMTSFGHWFPVSELPPLPKPPPEPEAITWYGPDIKPKIGQNIIVLNDNGNTWAYRWSENYSWESKTESYKDFRWAPWPKDKDE